MTLPSSLPPRVRDEGQKVDDPVVAARRELAQRELSRKRLMPFIVRNVKKYQPGWVHKVICKELEEFSEAVARGESPRLIIEVPPRHGKLLAHSTPILTPSGWQRHGDLQVGDQVFSPSGKPIDIVALSGEAVADWEVELTNGQRILCHGDHEWTVYQRNGTSPGWVTVETRWLGDGRKLLSGTRCNFQVPNIQALSFTENDLMMDPYVLGAWLGDGSRGKGCITHAADDQPVIDRIVAAGYDVSTVCTHKDTGVLTTYFSGPRPCVAGQMFRELKAMGILRDKRIPEGYLRGSIEQRLQLLAGLIDTDGHCDKNGRYRFTTADRALADGVIDLCTTLGFRPYTQIEQPKLSSSGIQGRREYYVIGFQPTCDLPCALSRKRATRIATQRRIGVRSVRRLTGEGELGRCIQVDAQDGLYLAGTTLIPTHNSEIVSRNFPAWHLGRYPHHEIIACSYGADLAKGFSRKVRELVKDGGYTSVFQDVGLDPGAQNLDHWLLDGHDGGYAAAGVGGPITGKGMHVGIIDDYVKNAEEADSATARESLWNWYESTFKSRLAPGGGIIVMATRWHEDDLIGRILEDEGTLDEGGVWKEVKFPAEAIVDEDYRKKGEPLHPERYDNRFFDQFRKNARVWWSLYQQSPVVEDGDYFKHDDFRFYRPSECPPLDELTIYCTGDFAVGTREVNDFTVFTVIGVANDDKIYVLDVFKLKEDSAAWVDKLFLIHDTYHPTLFMFEKGQISLAVEPFLKKRIRDEERWDFIYETIPTGRRDKVARARSIQGRMRQHLVLIPIMTSAPWVKDWMDELKKFPNGKHDDQVDSFAYVGLGLDEYYVTTKKVPRKKTTSWRDQLKGIKRSSGSTHMSA